MNIRFYALFAFCLLSITQLMGQSVITIDDTDLVAGGTYNWTNNNIYELDGLVYLEAGGTLNIEAGTVIRAIGAPSTGDNTSALIITRDAQIFAEGTATQPIIFTSEIDDPNDPNDMDATLDKGLWGGLIILGNATIARPGCEDGIEGIDASETRAKFGGAGNCGTFDEESSGVLRFVSIRHGGNALTEGNEINGLTLGGVGSGTIIEYVEVISNFDDGIEWFGGTVNVKYATVAFCGDDGFDYDFGWRGKGQFWFYLGDDEGSVGRGGEHDGANPDLQEPFSKPTIYNATYIGSGAGAVGLQGDGNDQALNLRDRVGGLYYNSIFTDFAGIALAIEDLPGDDMDTYANFLNGELAFFDNLWFGFGGGTTLETLISGAPAANVATQLVADGNSLADPSLAGVSRDPNGMLDPRPNAMSPALGTATGNTEDLFFSTVSYKGAFSNQNNWLRGWTALDEYGFLGDLVTPEDVDCDNPIVIQDGDLLGGQTYTWTSDNCYLLDGLVYLEEGGQLFIEPGTVIKAKGAPTTGDNTSALIITRGARIFAEGTAGEPIVFTSEIDDPEDPNDMDATLDKGLWGGVILLGRGTTARPGCEDGIEGIDASEERAKFGGAENCGFFDNESSGVIRYVSIRHGGNALTEGNEINGLTLGGVGSGTTIEYVEVISNFDDGIEWFGGTVDVKYAVVAFCGDDGFDYDYGWRGRGQYWFYLGDDEGSVGRGGEHDGANPDLQEPFAQPTIFNATYIGSGTGATGLQGDGNDFALNFRDRAGGYYHNSVFTDFTGQALVIEDLANDDMDTYANFLNGDLALRENVWGDFGAGTDLVSLIGGSNAADIAATLVDAGNELTDALNLAGIDRDPVGGLDPRPNFGSLARADGDTPTDNWFDNENYKGAFDPQEELWLNGWTALDEYGYLGDLVVNSAAGCENIIVVRDEDLVGGQSYTWTSENCYLLDGLVYLEAGGTLNIEPGTVVRGAATPTTGDNTSALIIARQARIFAIGSETNPIIFTADIDDPSNPNDMDATLDKGLWGGLVILGRGTIARPGCEDGIEGIDASEVRAKFGGGAECGMHDEESSGTLRYVSIRHGGTALTEGNEINGLTLGGVGSGTTIDYVEVMSNFDDGIEWFGGTVNVTHASVSFCGDDGFDYDFGWRGNGQFWFYLGDDEGSVGRAGEHDGADPDLQEPFSQPTIFNATYIGSGVGASGLQGDGNDQALNLRDRVGGFYHNSIFTDFPDQAIAIEDIDGDDMDTYALFLSGDLALRENIWWNFGASADLPALITGAPAEDVATQLVADGNTLEDPMIASISRDPNGLLDPRPNEGPARQDGDAPTNNFIQDVNYKGAFNPTAPLWLNNWSALWEYGYLGNLVNADDVEREGYVFYGIAPMPVADQATIRFELPRTADVSLYVYDLQGRLLETLIDNENRINGEHVVNYNANRLPNGQYLLVLDAEGYQLTQKMIVTK